MNSGGAERSFPSLSLRPAGALDSTLLFHWRNDPVTRANAVNQTPVTPDEHAGWLDRVLHDPDRTLLIADLDGDPVGVVRLDDHDGRAEISVTVAPGSRTKGIGRELIRIATKLAALPVDAYVRPTNAASMSAFLSVGYRRRGQTRNSGVLLEWLSSD